MSGTYNGHPSWDYWNVSLWVNNDENLYRMALGARRRWKSRRTAARWMLSTLHDLGYYRTDDGAKYNIARLAHAMEGME